MTSQYLGLRLLEETGFVKVKREISCFSQHFSVSTPEYGAFLTCKAGVFKKKVKDSNEQEVMVFSHPVFSTVRKMEVSIAQYPPLLIKPKGGFSRSIWICDQNKQHVLKLKPSSGFIKTCEFKILGLNEEPLGRIDRKWSSRSHKMTFPQELDVRYKGALIAACIYIDEISQSSD